MICRICGNTSKYAIYRCKEKMFKTEHTFDYFQCLYCGCLQILEIPNDMSIYYPKNYYSFHYDERGSSFLRRLLRNKRNRGLFDSDALGKLLSIFYKHPQLTALARLHPSKDSRILDVGSGEGSFLLQLSDIGFSDLTGVDPFIENDIVLGTNIKIIKTTLDYLPSERPFDIIMMSHSLEHMPDNVVVLRAANKQLIDRGIFIIIIPLVDSFAWRKYSTNWVQLDAPRHFYLHSLRSIELLAKKAGFEIYDKRFTSDAFQFIGSELYCKNMPLSSIKHLGLKWNIKKMYYQLVSIYLNWSNKGDQAVFYLRKIKKHE